VQYTNRSVSQAEIDITTLDESTLLQFVEEQLYTAVISDSLDSLGARDQAMREYLRPIHDRCVFAGWARTMLCVDTAEIPSDPYGKEIEAVDSLKPDEVMVCSTNKSIRNAPWGELLSTAARARGAKGAVIDGFVRDVRKIAEIRFPVFATGMKPVDSMGRGLVTGHNVPIECGEVRVNPGDLIVADFDGVVVVPRQLVPDTIRLAAKKVSAENHSRLELAAGSYLRDVYNKYGIL
jgi:4-hydroxy-4-methyl-2-oxoglutarate aldolase